VKTNRFIGWARVSSREQEQEGFSLDVQVDGFHAWAKRKGGVVDPIFRVSETATKSAQRKKFKELIDFAKRHADEYDGILFYKIDRGLRNMRDMVALEELEEKFHLPFISITQPVENTPSGRMMRRQLATIAAFTTEQQSLDVRDGINRRVQEGWFPSNPPYGYRTRRVAKRSIVEAHPHNADKVRRIFDLRANYGLTVPEIRERLFEEGLFYADSKPHFSKSKLNAILHDLSYIGFVRFKGNWCEGNHGALVDQVTWDRVRVSFYDQKYRSHELVYASQLIRCGHCGHVVTGEEKLKTTKNGTRSYVYYRCARYWTTDHPRVRLTEAEVDEQVERAIAPLKQICSRVTELINGIAESILAEKIRTSESQGTDTRRLLSLLDLQRKKLLSRNLSGAIPDQVYDEQMSEFAEQESILRRQLDQHEQTVSRANELIKGSCKVFVRIATDWSSLDRRRKQLVLSSLFDGFRLEGRTLVPVNGTRLELFRTE
jgi:site-specific DNA recombinase